MKRSPAAAHPARAPLFATTLAGAALLAGCTTSTDGLFSGDKVDYRANANASKPKPLDVPPDLTQLARDSRYQAQGGVVSAAATPGAAASAPVASGSTVAPLARGDIRVERDGNTRWLVVPMPPEQLWPILKSFWQERGFTIASDNADVGVMETDWAENRANLPQDVIRSSLGKLLGTLYDSGERDLYRTRVERTATGSEVYISHRGLEEVPTGGERDTGTTWRARPSDPQLEAEFLGRLMVRLGPQDNLARAPGSAGAASGAVAAVMNAPEQTARARTVDGAVAALEVDEPFDRAWRRVGLALDRSGFTVEDRDRAAGIYFVRYVDPKLAGKDEPGWWAKLWGDKTSRNPERYRVVVKNSGAKTVISVLAGTTGNEPGEAGQRIVGRLVNELR